MTRVTGPQCSPYFQPDTAPHPPGSPPSSPPGRSQSGAHKAKGRQNKSKAQQLYDLMHSSGRAKRRAGKPLARAEQHYDIVNALAQASAGILEESAGIAGQAAGKAALAAAPISAVWTLLDGLAAIGKAHADAQATAEQNQYIRGLAQAVGQAVDHPDRSPKAIRAALKQDGKYKDLLNLSTNGLFKLSRHKRKKYAKQAEKFQAGVGAGLKLVRTLGAQQRQELSALLQKRVGGDGTAERVSNLIKYGERIDD